jgi:hypothetical protein
MPRQIITRAERVKLFVREYYTSNSAWINVLRIIGGPLIIWAGIPLYLDSNRSAIGYGGFCFFYGIYYLLKPALIIAIRSSLFKSLQFDLQITEEALTLKEEGASTTIRFDLFKSILRNSGYYSVKLPEKTTIYFKENLLDEHEKAVLDQHLTS